jgi:hypothetical protein
MEIDILESLRNFQAVDYGNKQEMLPHVSSVPGLTGVVILQPVRHGSPCFHQSNAGGQPRRFGVGYTAKLGGSFIRACESGLSRILQRRKHILRDLSHQLFTPEWIVNVVVDDPDMSYVEGYIGLVS